MGRKEEQEIVIRTEMKLFIYSIILLLCFILLYVIGHINMVWSIICTIATLILLLFSYKAKIVIYNETNEGYLKIEDMDGDMHSLVLSKTEYIVFDKAKKVFLYDDISDEDSYVLLPKNEKLIEVLEKLGALKKELD